ncbi:hypothetical protein BM43_90 [Burkholderia gladioli]|nr:hypothetical protein BM43_90 [Burkholderia gladioli]
MLVEFVHRHHDPQRIQFTLQAIFKRVMNGRGMRKRLAQFAKLPVLHCHASGQPMDFRLGPLQTLIGSSIWR